MPHRYCSIGTRAQLAQPSRPMAVAVRRYTSRVGSDGPSCAHQSRNLGCHDSRARCSLPVGGQADVVGDPLAVVDDADRPVGRRRGADDLAGVLGGAGAAGRSVGGPIRPASCRSPRAGRSRTGAARPAAPRRWAAGKSSSARPSSRPKIFVSAVSGPAKRRLASMPVSASGEKLARSSMTSRISSAQSRSSGVWVTRPSRVAAAASRSSPAAASAACRLGLAAAEPDGQPGQRRWPSAAGRG